MDDNLRNYTEIDQQLAETAKYLEEHGVNVENFGAIGDFNEKTEEGTNNFDAFKQASDYAKVNNVPIYVPNKNYKVVGCLEIFDSLIGEGTIYFPNSDVESRLVVSSKHKPIILDHNAIGGLVEGSTNLTGLGSSYINHTLIIASWEVLIERYNPPTNKPYYKREVAMVSSKFGDIMPALDFTYNDKSMISSIKVVPPEKRLNVSVDMRGYGSVAKDNNLIVCTRSNVAFKDFSISSLKGSPIKTHININECAMTEFDNVKLSNGQYAGAGYGISIGNTAFTTVLNTHINDCRHSLSGAMGKAVVIQGGSYSGDIDSHWGSNYVIDNVVLNGDFSYAGKDITVQNCKVKTLTQHSFFVRTDTPELYGKVIIRNNIITAPEDVAQLIIFTFKGVSGQPENLFKRKLRTPSLVLIENNEIHVPAGKDVWLFNYGVLNYDQFPTGRIVTDGNKCVNGNRMYSAIDSTNHVSGTTTIEIRNQDLKGFTAAANNLRIRDRKTTEIGGYKFNITIENCLDSAISVDPSAVQKLTFLNSRVTYLGNSKITPDEGDGVWFNNCRIVGAYLAFPLGKMHFLNSTFEGAIQILERDIKLVSACYAKPGTTGLPVGLNLMSYYKP